MLFFFIHEANHVMLTTPTVNNDHRNRVVAKENAPQLKS